MFCTKRTSVYDGSWRPANSARRSRWCCPAARSGAKKKAEPAAASPPVAQSNDEPILASADIENRPTVVVEPSGADQAVPAVGSTATTAAPPPGPDEPVHLDRLRQGL